MKTTDLNIYEFFNVKQLIDRKTIEKAVEHAKHFKEESIKEKGEEVYNQYLNVLEFLLKELNTMSNHFFEVYKVVLHYQISTLKLDLDIFYEEEKSTIEVYGSSMWGAKTKKRYTQQERLIEKYKETNDLINLYAWCDVSGFEYWMKKMKESNYLSITVELLKNVYTDEEIIKIGESIVKADNYFERNLDDYYTLFEEFE